MSLASGVHPSDLCSPRACRPLPLLYLNLGIRTGGLWVCLSLNEEPKGPMISVFLTSAPVPSRTQLVANCSLMGVSQQCRGDPSSVTLQAHDSAASGENCTLHSRKISRFVCNSSQARPLPHARPTLSQAPSSPGGDCAEFILPAYRVDSRFWGLRAIWALPAQLHTPLLCFSVCLYDTRHWT